MQVSPKLTVIIPTKDRHEALRRCLDALRAANTSDAEIIVSVDGPDSGERAIARQTLPDAIVLESAVHAGPGAARNRAIDTAKGEFTLFLNDDVRVDPDCLDIHLAEQKALADEGRTAMILGSAPWQVPQHDRLFDKLLRDSSMIFFYDQMTGERAADPDHDWGFRHAWTLNLSMPTEALRAVGGFNESLRGAAYEDIELAHRLTTSRDMPVLYRPAAKVTHEHDYEPHQYLDRETRLGRDAVTLARVAPDCAAAIFGRDILAERSINALRTQLRHDADLAEHLRTSFTQLINVPTCSVTPDAIDAIVRSIYEAHRPLKKWCWASGFLAALGHSAGISESVAAA